MTILIKLPEFVGDELRQAFGSDLERAALESLVIEGYRSGRLSIRQVRRFLGLESRWDAEEWLGQHGVTWNYSLEDFEADQKTLAKLFGPSAS